MSINRVIISGNLTRAHARCTGYRRFLFRVR